METTQKGNLRTLHNLKDQKLYIRVYDEIRTYIEKNQLKPGDKLPTEMEMCQMLGVSRNVLREAIKSLEITGIVASKPGVGILIRDFNADYFMSSLLHSFPAQSDRQVEQYIEELRRVLELGFVDKAFASLTEEDIDMLGELLEQMRACAQKQEHSGKPLQIGAPFARADAAFHKTLFSHIDNKLMFSIIRFFWAYDKYYKEQTTPDAVSLTIEKHERIYMALKARDFTAFQDAMQFHFNVDYYKK